MTAALLEFMEIGKAFFGVTVLNNISFSVPAAGALGLVGENGAGKSTLMNILGGNLRADTGRMIFAGSEYRPNTPQDAERRGIAFIHQELNLFPNLNIAENLFLTRLPRKKGSPLISGISLFDQASNLLREVGLDIPPNRLVESISTGERQLVEIAKALAIDARLIIFDEPTTSLTAPETERLFSLIARLRAGGIAIIYISHTLDHVFQLCDQIITLRDGQIVANGPSKSFSRAHLISLMIGREITQLYPTRKPVPPGEPRLEVRNLSRQGALENISFTVHRGEIVGLAGLMGAGRSELARGIFGLDPVSEGSILVDDKPLKPVHPRSAIARGLGFLTENRGSEGLCLDSSVAENLSLATLPRHAPGPFRRLNFQSLHDAVQRIRAVVKIDVKAADSQPVRTLSGGNQQKVVLGKWLLNEPRVLILDEPTRGIDVGAKFEIYQLIQKLAENGAAILVISSEIEELIALCDRILVLRRGQLAAEFNRENFSREEILEAALSSTPR